MFRIGDEVLVTDQNPPAKGIIEEVNTWQKTGGGDICYLIRCEDWPRALWIDSIYVKSRMTMLEETTKHQINELI